MNVMQDSRCRRRAASENLQQVRVPAALDPFPTCKGTAGQPCLGRFETCVADETEHQPLLAPRWTQPGHERRPRSLAAAAPGTLHGVKLSFAPSYSHRAPLDRNNSASERLVFACQPNAVLLDQAFPRLIERNHRSTAGQMGAGVISVDRRR